MRIFNNAGVRRSKSGDGKSFCYSNMKSSPVWRSALLFLSTHDFFIVNWLFSRWYDNNAIPPREMAYGTSDDNKSNQH